MRIILTAAERDEITAVLAEFDARSGYSEVARELFKTLLPQYWIGDTYEACMVAAAILAHAEVEGDAVEQVRAP